MKTLYLKQPIFLKAVIVLITLGIYLGQSSAVFARPPQDRPSYRGGGYHHYSKSRYPRARHYQRPYGRHYGGYYRSPPRDVFWLTMGGAVMFYSMGRYYQSVNDGYIEVAPPLGARVRELPPNCTTYYSNGRRIYDCQDAYYDRDGQEYVVINRPVEERVVINAGDGVTITISSLNIRRGPGTQYDVIGVLYKGNVVEVDGVENGWYYVRLSNGSFGWISAKYTTPYQAYDAPRG